MKWKKAVNITLEGMIGYSIQRVRPRNPVPLLPPRMPGDKMRPPAERDDRLLRAPVFVLAPVRSGSTLLRVLLNSHSWIHAPHETHFRRMTVNLPTDPLQQALAALGHNHSDVEHILWDRMLHRELARSGKRVLVEKTPSNVFAWLRISTCWPDARPVYLQRHPVSIAQSWHEADPEMRPMEEAVRLISQYGKYMDDARRMTPGITLSYEALTERPEEELRRLCAHLGLPWEPEMLQYGRHDHGEFVKGIGDWREKIRTGSVQPGRPLPDAAEVPEELKPMCESWGYL
ncbi:sulfotransferase [Streptosporangiaceae bacterium NEAU-GS5]|nr:sulfotransferase [Streptosporangiaceae bacterium NEAU-GS5]